MFRPNGSFDPNDALCVIVERPGDGGERMSVYGFTSKGVMVKVRDRKTRERIVKVIPYRKVVRYAFPWESFAPEANLHNILPLCNKGSQRIF